MPKAEYRRCVAITHSDYEGLSWCGRDIREEFHFTEIDHAALNGLSLGRLTICSRCRELIIKCLSHEKFDDKIIENIQSTLESKQLIKKNSRQKLLDEIKKHEKEIASLNEILALMKDEDLK